MSDIVEQLKALEKQSEDNIWRTAQIAREEIERLREIEKKYQEEQGLSQRWPARTRPMI